MIRICQENTSAVIKKPCYSSKYRLLNLLFQFTDQSKLFVDLIVACIEGKFWSIVTNGEQL